MEKQQRRLYSIPSGASSAFSASSASSCQAVASIFLPGRPSLNTSSIAASCVPLSEAREVAAVVEVQGSSGMSFHVGPLPLSRWLRQPPTYIVVALFFVLSVWFSLHSNLSWSTRRPFALLKVTDHFTDVKVPCRGPRGVDLDDSKDDTVIATLLDGCMTRDSTQLAPPSLTPNANYPSTSRPSATVRWELCGSQAAALLVDGGRTLRSLRPARRLSDIRPQGR